MLSSLPIVVDVFSDSYFVDIMFDDDQEDAEDTFLRENRQMSQIQRTSYEVGFLDSKEIPLRLRSAGSRNPLDLSSATFVARATNPDYIDNPDIPIDLTNPETNLAQGLVILSVNNTNITGMAGLWSIEIIMTTPSESRVILIIKLSVVTE